MRLRLFILSILMFFTQVCAFAQDATISTPDMASELRQSGKIYVVVLVMATIFAGIILFLVFLDRKVRKLEKKSSNSVN